jgi:hypothetical protein
MTKRLTKPEVALLLGVIIVFAWVGWWQHNRLQAIQMQQKKRHYAVRLRAAQAIIETEMLHAAYLTTSDDRTRQLARHYLERPIE